jgi:hypothetical protein
MGASKRVEEFGFNAPKSPNLVWEAQVQEEQQLLRAGRVSCYNILIRLKKKRKKRNGQRQTEKKKSFFRTDDTKRISQPKGFSFASPFFLVFLSRAPLLTDNDYPLGQSSGHKRVIGLITKGENIP